MSLCMAPLQKNFGFEVQGAAVAEEGHGLPH